MATFKVGQRVRIVAVFSPKFSAYIGTEGIITYITKMRGIVCFWRSDFDGREWGADSWRYFAPLTDPKADAFIERIRKMKPYSEPVVTKVKA